MKWNDWVQELGPPLLRYFSADGWYRSTAADGVPVNAQTLTGQTALMLAADQGCGKTVKELLRYRQIRVGLRDDYGKSALDYAKDADIMGIDGAGYDLILAKVKETEARIKSSIRLQPAD